MQYMHVGGGGGGISFIERIKFRKKNAWGAYHSYLPNIWYNKKSDVNIGVSAH